MYADLGMQRGLDGDATYKLTQEHFYPEGNSSLTLPRKVQEAATLKTTGGCNTHIVSSGQVQLQLFHFL